MEKLEETLMNNNIYMKLSLTVGALRPKLLPNYMGGFGVPKIKEYINALKCLGLKKLKSQTINGRKFL